MTEKPSEGNCRVCLGKNVPGNQAAVGAERCKSKIGLGAVAEGCSMGRELN